jgi:nucleolar pre-ribosomal-associated protein 2
LQNLQPIFEPTLPKLRSLNESKDTAHAQLLYAVDIVGFTLIETPNLSQPYDDFVFASTSGKRPSPARVEGILRWLLEKLKNRNDSNEFVLLLDSWRFLGSLVESLPTANVARILNANGILTIVKLALEKLIPKFVVRPVGSDSEDSRDRYRAGLTANVSAERQRPLKRKRGQDSPPPTKYSKNNLEILRALSNFLSLLISKAGLGVASTGRRRNTDAQFAAGAVSKIEPQNDPIAAEHIKSVLRTNTTEAAEILGLCLHCISNIITTQWLDLGKGAEEQYSTSLILPVLQIWQLRSHESDDNLGSSADIFSKECLVPVAKLYSQLRPNTNTETSSNASKIVSFLEQLFARHVLMPARASFSTIKDQKRKKQSNGLLHTYLEPLQVEIALSAADNGKSLIQILPHLLEEAIKLSPRGSPKQKEAEIPWIENVFAALSCCAGEPIPFSPVDSPLTGKDISPLASMLLVVQKHNITLSSAFLENILVDYSGLMPLAERLAIQNLPKPEGVKEAAQNVAPQWRTISMLLRLDGNMFLKRRDGSDSKPKLFSYVDALAKAVADEPWIQEPSFSGPVTHTSEVCDANANYSFEVVWEKDRKTVVSQIVIPLMQAYHSARDLVGFMNLWFRELRRDWMELGAVSEGRLAWTANELRHAFWELLQESLTASKINEQIVEYVLPVKELADEAAKKANHSMDWSKLQAIAPASAAIFMLDVIVQGIDREDIFQQNLPTFTALISEVSRYTKFSLSQFSCASRVWSIYTQLQELAPRVNVAEAFQTQREQLLASGVLELALKSISNLSTVSVPSSQYLSGQEAYRCVIVLCSELLDLPDLKARAEEYIKSANSVLNQDLDSFAGEHFPLPKPDGKEDWLLVTRIIDPLLVLIQCPQALKTLDTEQRSKLFYTLFHYTLFEKRGGKQNLLKDTPVTKPTTSIQAVLDATLEAVVAFGSYSIMHDLVQTLTSQLSSPKKVGKELAVDIFLKLSPVAISRRDREIILDKLSDTIALRIEDTDTISNTVTGDELEASDTFFDNETRAKAVALMIRLLATANTTAKVVCVSPG